MLCLGFTKRVLLLGALLGATALSFTPRVEASERGRAKGARLSKSAKSATNRAPLILALAEIDPTRKLEALPLPGAAAAPAETPSPIDIGARGVALPAPPDPVPAAQEIVPGQRRVLEAGKAMAFSYAQPLVEREGLRLIESFGETPLLTGTLAGGAAVLGAAALVGLGATTESRMAASPSFTVGRLDFRLTGLYDFSKREWMGLLRLDVARLFDPAPGPEQNNDAFAHEPEHARARAQRGLFLGALPLSF